MRITIIIKKFILYILYTLVIVLIVLNSKLLISIILDDKINDNNLTVVESKEVEVKHDGQIRCRIVLSNKEVIYVNQSTCFVIKEGTIFNLEEGKEVITND